MSLPTVYLSAADFANGTYRGQQDANYVLTSDVSFEPQVPTTKVASGFYFAALTIEAKKARLFMNGFKIEMSKKYAGLLGQAGANITNVYANILLANSPYPGNGTPGSFGQR